MLVMITAALAGNPPPPPIVNGSTTKDYEQVVTLASVDRSGNVYNFCSGTLIAPGWVVTAGHCTEAFSSNEDLGYRDHYVLVGYDLTKDSGVTEYAKVKKWHTHPSFYMDASSIENDIGVVELETDITTFDPMPVNRDAIRTSEIGDDYRYVGWGITSDNETDSTKKRTADLPLDNFDNQFMYAYDTKDNQNVCSGDSGGAGLEILSNGGFELAAVNSFVYSPNGDSTPCKGGATGGTRVDKFLSWVEGYTPTQSYTEMYGDSDTDADTDSDSDADADTDADSDADSDSDSGTGKKSTHNDDGSTTDTYTWTCSSSGAPANNAPAGMLALAMVGAALVRRREG